MTFRKINKIHFVGIGGIGMSGIAELLKNLGFSVTGSDITKSRNVERLINLGINIKIGHKPENLGSADVLVYSSAVLIENPEIISLSKDFVRQKSKYYSSFFLDNVGNKPLLPKFGSHKIFGSG